MELEQIILEHIVNTCKSEDLKWSSLVQYMKGYFFDVLAVFCLVYGLIDKLLYMLVLQVGRKKRGRERSCLGLVVFYPAETLNAGLRPSASPSTAHSTQQLINTFSSSDCPHLSSLTRNHSHKLSSVKHKPYTCSIIRHANNSECGFV